MTGHITHTAPIEQVFDLINHAVTVLLSVISAAGGYGVGSWIEGVL